MTAAPADTSRRARMPPLLRALRPAQWTKNVVVLAAFFFALWDRHQALGLAALLRVLPATLLFCAISSGVYLVNDIIDCDADRRHPAKRHRPIAAGKLSVPAAWTAAILLLATGLGGSALLSQPFFAVAAAYVVIQLCYSVGLKRLALVDVLVIAMGFVLRALAGAVVLGIAISPWLLLCAFLLALFLALCKRRHELLLQAGHGTDSRPSLSCYDERLLDALIAICGGATIVSYSIYTLWPATVEKFGTPALGFTIPFVVFGVFRYLDLAYRLRQGDRPEKVLLTDIPIMVNLVLYGLSIVAIFCLFR